VLGVTEMAEVKESTWGDWRPSTLVGPSAPTTNDNNQN